MRIVILYFLVFQIFCHGAIGFGQPQKNNRVRKEIIKDPIDSLYNKLIEDRADSIILYHELRNSLETEGIISWKWNDTLWGLKFKTRSEVIYQHQKLDIDKSQLKTARRLYFANEKKILDTLPKIPWKISDDFMIDIISYQNGRERRHKLYSSQVMFIKNPPTIVQVASMLHDLIYDN
jgi:hypothetical protein